MGYYLWVGDKSYENFEDLINNVKNYEKIRIIENFFEENTSINDILFLKNNNNILYLLDRDTNFTGQHILPLNYGKKVSLGTSVIKYFI